MFDHEQLVRDPNGRLCLIASIRTPDDDNWWDEHTGRSPEEAEPGEIAYDVSYNLEVIDAVSTYSGRWLTAAD